MDKKRTKKKKKYVLIHKIHCEGCDECLTVYPSGKKWQKPVCSRDFFTRYRADDVGKTNAFISAKYGNWTYVKIYDNLTKELIGTYKRSDAPMGKDV